MQVNPETLGKCPELNLTFRTLSYSVPDKGGKMKEVLHDVSGHILSGRLTAVLGSSGAGKTSLMNVLAGFNTIGVQGTVFVNGVKRSQSDFRTQSCYITQDVQMLEVLTAQETLEVAAKLKLSQYTDHLGNTVVSDIMDLLNLTQCRHTRVEHMSGGEQKRLSIGIELITNPPIMFFDEPTSGLDSVSATQVITHLRSLARSGRAVACVIHQPSSKLCHMFDDVILMSGGHLLYCGSLDELVPVFEEAGFSYPKDYNKADFALEVACRERGEDLSPLLERSTSSKENQDTSYAIPPTENTQMIPLEETAITVDTKLNHIEVSSSNNSCNKKRNSRYPNSCLRQFQILFQRSIRVTAREKYMTKMRILVHLFMALLLGTLCFDVGNDAAKIFTNTASLFFLLMFTYFVTSMVSALMFPKEMAVLIRELRNNWYCLPAYFAAKCISNIPMQLLCPSILVFVAYFMTGQPHEVPRLAITWVVIVILGVLAQTMGMAFGAAFGAELGIFLIPATSVPLVLFSGFFVQLPDIPSYLRWLAEASYFKHGFEAVMGAVYGAKRSNLDCSQEFCFYKYPSKFLDHLAVNEDNLGYNMTVLVAWAVCTHIGLYIILMWRLRNAR